MSNGRLVEGNGNDFVMRGVNHAHTWHPGRTGAIGGIKAKGADTVRVVLSSGDRWTKTGAVRPRSPASSTAASRTS